MDQKPNSVEGWMVVELFGHVREAGYLNTEYFGTGALFRLEVPELPERERLLDRPQWIDGVLAGKGSTIMVPSCPGRTRFIGPGAIYAMNPCTEEAAIKAIEAMSPREPKVIQLVKPRQLSEHFEIEDGEDDLSQAI